ncbi:MAG: DUF3160 domain-containing protein [Patescibacteria group bacterium]
MFSDQSTILSSELEPSAGSSLPESAPSSPNRKIIFMIALALATILLMVGIFFVVKKFVSPKTEEPMAETEIIATTTEIVPAVLPDLNAPETATTTVATSSFSNLAIEYLSFADFYKTPDNSVTLKLSDYKLPLNIKIDVMNYYDVSRKLSLDPALDKLNSQGFAVIDNPSTKDVLDFYSAYSFLDSKQLPLLITSDYMIYYYQNVLKKAFKDVEENVFYDNLWDINKELYTAAKERYEARLAAIGNINDSILEGERLETAFFAAALELLKPTAEQLKTGQSNPVTGSFTSSDADRFYFVTPPYLKDDVLAEVKLIRDAKLKAKSPVMLYNRDYVEFSVPFDYKANAKLNNFYLTTAWLNSVFPLNYRGKDCAACLLDAADWRVNMIAASFISKDFSELPGLKNKWARIYKVMSFFKGLREDLNYVHYRDSLVAAFGADYKIEELFADSNKSAVANLEKLRAKALAYDFAEINGALNKKDVSLKPRLGLKPLAESYWPNNYIFSRLTSPAVGTFNATTTASNDITTCLDNKIYKRCNGFALDVVNLTYPIGNNNYFNINTNFSGYGQAASGLQSELVKNNVWHTNNYWANLSSIKALLTINKENLPLFARSSAWQDKSLRTAAGAWINLQLPMDKFSTGGSVKSSGLNNAASWNENSYVEPNLDLINELLADTAMVIQMFSALQLDTEVRVALQDIKNFSGSLEEMKVIVLKELTSGELNAADNEAIADFAKQFKTTAASVKEKQMSLKLPQQKTALKEDLSRLKLLLIVHQEGENKVFSVGPVWDYQESH